MLIIDDPPGSLPAEVANLEERHFVVSDVRPRSLARVGLRQAVACRTAGGSAAACVEPFWTMEKAASAPLDGTLLVNGKYQPCTALDAEQWYRFRILFGSAGGGAGSGRGMMGGGGGSDWSGSDLQPALPGCETGLLAKDGVYLDRAPRPISHGYMSAGNRADWLVKCPAGAHALIDQTSGAVLAFVTAAHTSSAPPAPPLAPFRVERPCYLVDLRAASATGTHSIRLPGMRFSVDVDGGGASAFAGPNTPSAVLPVGAVIELTLGGTSVMDHIFHMHVNPFQLQDDVPDSTIRVAGNYFQSRRAASPRLRLA